MYSMTSQIRIVTQMMGMAHPIANSVETLTKDSGCSLDKDFTKLIYITP